jgi:hypothetical protein
MNNAERAHCLLRDIRKIMQDEGIDPNLNDVAEFYRNRPDIQRRLEIK